MRKNEFYFGKKYAEFISQTSVEPGLNVPVDVDAMVMSSVDIPEGDYREMKRAGIKNPDSRKYWMGFNAYFEK